MDAVYNHAECDLHSTVTHRFWLEFLMLECAQAAAGFFVRKILSYAPLVLDLQSPDPSRRSIALGALTEHPQEFLEPVILKLSQDPATMSAVIVGLKKLERIRPNEDWPNSATPNTTNPCGSPPQSL